MNKAIIAVALLAAVPFASQAKESGPGCGLGSQLFEGQSGVAPHVLAVTTNGISGNQTFGMTTGSLGCDPSQTITIAAADIYLNANMEKVARGMATGEGEALDTLADLMGIEAQDKTVFFKASQQNFGKIFSSNDISSNDVLAALKDVMKNDNVLAKYVS